MDIPCDSILVLSFGGPECDADVLPFLENVLRGRNVPRERMLEVAEHYYHFGGKSPINDQNRALIRCLRAELDRQGIQLPIFWGNRNWHPLLADTLREMGEAGHRRALCLVTSAFGSYSGCRQYLQDIERASVQVGSIAPQIEKLRTFSLHRRFVNAMVARVQEAFSQLDAAERAAAKLIFTAHSIPLAMAETGPYEGELREASRRVAEEVGKLDWQLAYQSRSGPPQQKWLEPDIGEVLRSIGRQAPNSPIVIAPIGFISDHMEVIYDLDFEAKAICQELNLKYVRAGTVGVHPEFIAMICDLIRERIAGKVPPYQCAQGCCAYVPAGRPVGA